MNIFKAFISVFLLCFSFQTFSQSSDTLEYFDANWKPVLSKTDAKYYRIKKTDPQNPDKFSFEAYYVYVSTDKLQSIGAYESYKEDIKTGLFTYYYENGNRKSVFRYVKGKVSGLSTSWFENGKIQEESNYVSGKLNGIQKKYYESGKLLEEMNYKENMADGSRKSYFETGELKGEMTYAAGKLDGEAKVSYKNGKLRRMSTFKSGEELKSECYTETGKKKKCLNPLMSLPLPKGGMQAVSAFVSKELVYPEQAHKAGIEGKVFITFLVDEAGNITNPFVLKGMHELLDKEALRVVSDMSAWQPGYQDDEPVKVKFTLPINFKIN